MKSLSKLGVLGALLGLMLLLQGCGAHAGFNIGSRSHPEQLAQVSQSTINE